MFHVEHFCTVMKMSFLQHVDVPCGTLAEGENGVMEVGCVVTLES